MIAAVVIWFILIVTSLAMWTRLNRPVSSSKTQQFEAPAVGFLTLLSIKSAQCSLKVSDFHWFVDPFLSHNIPHHTRITTFSAPDVRKLRSVNRSSVRSKTPLRSHKRRIPALDQWIWFQFRGGLTMEYWEYFKGISWGTMDWVVG